MPEQIENLDSLNEEQYAEVSEEETEDVSALQERLNKLSGQNRQLFERAKKAEGFEKNSEGKWVKTQKPEKPEPTPTPQSNEPDYAKLAYLKAEGVIHPDDQKIVQDEAARLKLPLTDVLQMEHIKGKLTASKDQREAMAGMPKGQGRGGNKAQNDVDYWLAKPPKADGTYETPSDLDLAEKVINARIQKDQNANMFSDDLYA